MLGAMYESWLGQSGHLHCAPFQVNMSTLNIPPNVIKLAALLGPLVSISTASTIASFSFLQAPILRSIAKNDPVLALGHVRWYFETGKHLNPSRIQSDSIGKYIFPQLSMVSGALFSVLAYAHPARRGGFIGAAVGCLSILPFTSLYMTPNRQQQDPRTRR